jgi:hypothetical protein
MAADHLRELGYFTVKAARRGKPYLKSEATKGKTAREKGAGGRAGKLTSKFTFKMYLRTLN